MAKKNKRELKEKKALHAQFVVERQADSGGVTEAGTTIRDVIREGVPSISVSLPVSLSWLKRLRRLKKEPYLDVEWMDPETGELSTGIMYMDGFKVSLEHDTSAGGLWTVSFSLEDLDDV